MINKLFLLRKIPSSKQYFESIVYTDIKYSSKLYIMKGASHKAVQRIEHITMFIFF